MELLVGIFVTLGLWGAIEAFDAAMASWSLAWPLSLCLAAVIAFGGVFIVVGDEDLW